ncbi:porin [Paraburkholderia nemoris]|uniref:Outer membrane porin protein n=1 Tax=Paraburkholderia nemoris TaxID=2793076 RepID=A0ABM8QYS4_9BURK|nr:MULTISPECIES: porin [Paraburkholderia]MBK3810100.1 porin [Paraburkholderia aspalathi]CAE6723764.1 Outer membrane porin protein [Paraburkholderia nemoris]CAE6749330.1 Outer membrane porin protein [Paraburkholderia nemoris]
MKTLVMGALCAACGTSAAYAQSSVTLYGVLDVGLTALSNQSGHGNVVMDTGVLAPNLFGLKGAEDLGGGVKAVFQLEGQFEMGTGTLDGNLFGRQSWVGIESDRWGTLTVGNQYDYMFTSLSWNRLGPEIYFVSLTNLRQGPFDAFGKPLAPSGDFDFDRTAGAQRMSNSIRYQAPVIDGLTFGGMYGFGNQAGTFGNQNAYSFGVDYMQSTFSLDAAYTLVKYLGIDNGNGGIRNFGFGGRIAVMQGWADVLYTNTRNTFSGATISAFEVGGTYPLMRATTLAFAYEFMKGNDALENNRAHQVNLTLDYALSKRSDVYISAAYQHASGDGNTATAWILDAAGPSTSGNQTILRVGMRHIF